MAAGVITRVVSACAAALGLGAAGAAQDAPVDWRAAALEDLADARAVIGQHHPGMAESLGDEAFIAMEGAAADRARGFAQQASAFPGYIAALNAYAAGLGDPHIRMRYADNVQTVEWPGVLTKRAGGRFVVRASQLDAVGPGDALIACDGETADDMAARSLGVFRADWRFEAERIRTATYLFVRFGDPFWPRPDACVFEREGERVEVAMAWRKTPIEDLNAVLAETAAPRRTTFDARTFEDGGVWIRLPRLSGDARDFVDGLRRDQRALRAAPWVVVDVRGNGGGDSSIGDQLADLLGLPDASPALVSGEESMNWRASIANADAIASYPERLGGGFLSNSSWRFQASRVRAAAERGDEFWPDLPEERPVVSPAPLSSTPVGNARVILLTDHVCFSSCLIMADRFVRNGAAHIGGATSFSTRFLEIRRQDLPSGRASISTLQKVALHWPALWGPFEPSAVYPGDLDDDAGVEAWVVDLIGER